MPADPSIFPTDAVNLDVNLFMRNVPDVVLPVLPFVLKGRGIEIESECGLLFPWKAVGYAPLKKSS